MTALENAPDAVARKVSKFVTIQTPYFGTEVADWFLINPLLYNTALGYSRLLNPRRILSVFPFFRGATIREMTRAERGKLPDERPKIRKSIRLYSVATRVHTSDAIRLLLWVSSGLVARLTGRDNDGLVTTPDAVFPGSRYALLDEVGTRVATE